MNFALIFLLTELFTEETVVQEESAAEEVIEAEAAIKIQAAFRGMQARTQVKAMKEEKGDEACYHGGEFDDRRWRHRGRSLSQRVHA